MRDIRNGRHEMPNFDDAVRLTRLLEATDISSHQAVAVRLTTDARLDVFSGVVSGGMGRVQGCCHPSRQRPQKTVMLRYFRLRRNGQ